MNTFDPVGSQVHFPAIEKEVLASWRASGAFRRSLEQTRGKREYMFYDGPPFATGLPHYGHLLAGAIKDIVPRYWTMRGCHVERRFGWDCHGLPIEYEMEKELKVSGKRDIEKLGVHIFNEACRSIVLRYTSQWQAIVERMGRWVDFDHQYRTMDPEYMESIWWVFKEVWKKDLIYQGFRVQPYCPRCATPLSNFEMNEGYRDVQGPSITVTFPVVDDPRIKFLVWTTTPWTLPSNAVLAVGADIRYVKVRDGADFYILAKDRLAAYFPKESDWCIEEEMQGAALAGMRYAPLFDYFCGRGTDFFTVTTADFVSTEDGTGVVHIAPAFGEDDFQVGKKLKLPIVCPVDDEGKFTAEVSDWSGQQVFDADASIIQRIKRDGRLFHRSTVMHRYPHCYRCDTPLIYKAMTTWFMKIEPLKANMLANNQQIRWVPGHLQNGRFGKGVESAPDWNISRNRYWGTPIPVWRCACGHVACVGSIDEMHRLAGRGDAAAGLRAHQEAVANLRRSLAHDARDRLAACGMDVSWAERLAHANIPNNDLHLHVVDALTLSCPQCGAAMKRTSEVLDCWFESGSMPYAQLHYPFEHADDFPRLFPADFIAEGLDQTRGWFYTLTALGSALFAKPAFKNVIVNGIVLSEDGKKLSKRLKNYTPPEEALEKLGADALRLFLINSPAVKAEDLRYSDKGVQEMARAVLLPYWNAYSFFVTYANVDGWRPAARLNPASGNELDRWIASLLNRVIGQVNAEMEQYNLYRVAPLLVDFIDNLTNWYIRRSRRRFWKSESDADKAQAYETLYWVLVEFAKVMAPFLPFLTEAIYRNLAVGKLADAAPSVHLAPFPVADPARSDPALEMKMALVRQAVVMGRSLRSRHNLKVRQPLAKVTIIVRDAAKRALLSPMSALIADELNVKEAVFSADEEAVVQVSAKANFKALGKTLGPRMKEAAAVIEKFTLDDIRGLERGETRRVCDYDIAAGHIEIRRAKKEGVEAETEGELTVALDTALTPELRQEGLAREFVNRVQNARKQAGLDVTDRIAIACACPQELCQAVNRFRGFIGDETLAVSMECAEEIEGGEAIEIDGFAATLRISKVRAS